MHSDIPRLLPVIGWREWLALPALEIPQIKAKIDTGARTSALHALDIELIETAGRTQVRFKTQPYQNSPITITSAAELIENRMIKNSGGYQENRPVIRTMAQLGDYLWPLELTLTSRDNMGFRMLLGRQALRDHFLVDPGHSFLQNRRTAANPS